ncbi:MAG: hypothetical protein AAGC85_19160 [Bacteroidota bacterium]
MSKRTKGITLALIGGMLLEGIVFFLSGGKLSEVGSAAFAFFSGAEFAWSPFLQGLFWSMMGFFLIGVISGPKDQFPLEESQKLVKKETTKGEKNIPKTNPQETEEKGKPEERIEEEEIQKRKERLKSGRLFGNKK